MEIVLWSRDFVEKTRKNIRTVSKIFMLLLPRSFLLRLLHVILGEVDYQSRAMGPDVGEAWHDFLGIPR